MATRNSAKIPPPALLLAGAALGDTADIDVGAADDLCAQAMTLQLDGRPDLAGEIYDRILKQCPRHAAANYCRGMLEVQRNRPADGLPHLLAALEERPTQGDYWLGYLEGLLSSGRTAEASQTLGLARRHGLAGAAADELGRRIDAAEGAARSEAELLAAVKRGDLEEARGIARGLTEQLPRRGLGWKIHGALLWADGRHEAALAAMQTAARLLPGDPEALSNLGLTLAKLSRFPEAEDALHGALELDPLFATAHYRLGMAYEMQARYPEAVASHRTAIALDSNYVQGDNELGYSNLLFMLSHSATATVETLFEEHRRFGERFEAPLRSTWPKHANTRDPARRLRIGLVSGDLRNHAVATFLEPLLVQLKDHPGLELTAYYTHDTEDEVSSRLRACVSRWRSVFALTDPELCDLIQADRIDILLDLSGHTYRNRLMAFARKPAPVQASWIGYPGTTGLLAMDYFLGDPHFLPRGQFDGQFTEKLVYLPAQTPFLPHPTAPPVNELPALSKGRMTFGSFNRVAKITPPTIDLWSQLLCALPDSEMLIGGATPAQQRDLVRRLATADVAEGRLKFHARCDLDSYLALHHQVDLCLDTFPYNGGTTNIHAVWMGVPTLTVAGPTPAARQGAAILSQVGLTGFTTANTGEFLSRGMYWAQHPAELAEIRRGLRRRLQDSPSRRADVIVVALEQALRRMWRRWCERLPPESFACDALESVT